MEFIKRHKLACVIGTILFIIIFTRIVIFYYFSTEVIDLVNNSKVSAFTTLANTVVSNTETLVIFDEFDGQSKEGTYCYTVKYLVDNDYLNNVTAANYGAVTTGYAGYVKVIKYSEENYEYYISFVDYNNGYNVISYNYTSNGILSSSYEGLNLTINSSSNFGPTSSNDISFDTDCSEENTYK